VLRLRLPKEIQAFPIAGIGFRYSNKCILLVVGLLCITMLPLPRLLLLGYGADGLLEGRPFSEGISPVQGATCHSRN